MHKKYFKTQQKQLKVHWSLRFKPEEYLKYFAKPAVFT